MPRKIDDRIRNLAGETYAKTELTLPQIAKKFKVSDRTVQTWSTEDHWEAQRTAQKSIAPQNVIDFARQPKAETTPLIRSRAAIKVDNPIEIANTVIKDLQGEMVAGMPGKDKASVANALKAWVEYREKLQPVTVEDLADQVIQKLHDWNLSARDFAIALKNRAEGNKRA
jgi:hypothetical protein